MRAACAFFFALTRDGLSRGPLLQQAACAALLAVRHVNTRDASVVPGLGQLVANLSMHGELFDTGSAESSASVAFQRASQWGAVAMIGGGASDVTELMAYMAAGDNKALIGYRSTSSSLGHSDFGNFGRTIPSDAVATRILPRLLLAFGWRHAAVVFERRNEWSRSYAASLEARAAEAGVQLMEVVSYDSSQPASYASAMRRVAASGASVVIGLLTDASIGPMLRAADAEGLLRSGTAWILADGVTAAALSEAAQAGEAPLADLLDGVLRLAASPAGAPGHQRFLTAWRGQGQAEANGGASVCANPIFDASAAPQLV